MTNVDQWPPASRERLVQRVQLRGRHADVDRALGHRQHVGAGIAQELFEAVAEIVVGDLPLLAAELVLHRRAVVHVVRWIGEDHVGQAAGQDLLHSLHLRGIAAEQPVLAQHPDIAGHGDRGLRRLRHRVFVGVAGVDLFRVAEQILDLLVGEADDVEIEAVLLERLQFDAQHLLIPSGVERQPVVGQNKRAPLRFGQMVEDDDRDFGHAQFAGGQQAGVAGDDDPIGAGKNWVRPPELGDRWPRSGRPVRHYACAHSGRRESASRPATSLPAGSS